VNSTILNDIVRDYEAVSTSWFSALGPIANKIFWILVAIQLTGRGDRVLLRAAAKRGNLESRGDQELLPSGRHGRRNHRPQPHGIFDQGLALANKILNSTADLGLLEGFFATLIAAVTALVVVIAFAIIAAQLLVALVESFIVIGAGVLFLGFAGSRWTKFFTERYLSYIASVGVKLFVLYLIMGVGMGIAARWMTVLERGGFSPIPFLYVMGGSLVFVFLTWHIPSVAGTMMSGAVSLSLADAVYPAMWGSRAAAAGLFAAGATAGTAVGAGRWAMDHLRVHTSLHTGDGRPPGAQSLATAVTAQSPSDAGQPRSAARPGPSGSKASAPAGGTHGPEGAPSGTKETGSAPDGSRSG
jgi:type IV secretion system protein TrbL